MLYRRGDPVWFFLNGNFYQGVVLEDEQPNGLIDVESDNTIYHGLSRNLLTPLSRSAVNTRAEPVAS